MHALVALALAVQQLKRKFELYNNVTPLSIKPLKRNVSDNEKSKMLHRRNEYGAIFICLVCENVPFPFSSPNQMETFQYVTFTCADLLWCGSI